jgi:HEPN domain-containing protein
MDLRGVVGREEVEILRERALMFLAAARDDLRAGRVDLAAFHAEQACQLALKYVLASRVGCYPHTHSLRRLFEEVRAVKPELWSFYERHMFAFEVMEDAYLGARYLPRRYSRDVAEHLVKVAEELVALCT